MTRDEHIAWAKQRAMDELDFGGGPSTAVASVMSDLRKHPETRNHTAIMLMGELQFFGHLSTARQVREFVAGIL